ncbi:hypothetical protein KAR91_13955 [Candidatus Pacearchaeota archaeon]|nr:hypothetical protein [Candidatus Pacearchaeota archaeon]
MDDEQVVRCTEELTRFKIAWEAAATQACYELHRAGNCLWCVGPQNNRRCCWDHATTYEIVSLNPCPAHYLDCPLHRPEGAIASNKDGG